MLSDTLNKIENLYNTLTSDPEHPKLMSKLATIELCGWIEETMDNIIRDIDLITTNDRTWVDKQLKLIHGFDYDKHFRKLLCQLLGEHRTRQYEAIMDKKYPGDLDRLKSKLNTLWRIRCEYAHQNLEVSIRKQSNFNAPSVTKNDYNDLDRLLTKLKESIKITLK